MRNPGPPKADPTPPSADPAPPPQVGEPAADNGEPAADNGEPSRTGRNLPVAIGIGLLLGIAPVVTLFTVKSTFLVYVGLAVALAIWELSRAVRGRDIQIPLVPIYAGGTALWTCTYWLGYKAGFAALGLTMMAVLAWRLHGPADGYLRDVTAGMFTVMYLPVAGVFVALMVSEPNGGHRAFLFVVLAVCSDTGGYAGGVLFGKHLIAPAISPKKTWEGLAGSSVFCLVAGGILLPVLLHGKVWQGLLLGAAVVVVAFLGDLVESMMKRDLGIKDMGSLLPGHGGVLDRIDAMIVSAPLTWLLLIAFFPAH
ncbi:MAG TPA: phosphatidate cytidylyltransferase [Streptosporangiaceae bacterium]